jgi:hypothetical protein
MEGHRGRDHMVIGFATTYAISVYHHYRCKKNIEVALQNLHL